MRRYEASIDPEVCIGAQMCVGIAPETFEFDEQTRTTRVVGGASEDDGLLDAADMCPVSAIVVRDADSGEQLS